MRIKMSPLTKEPVITACQTLWPECSEIRIRLIPTSPFWTDMTVLTRGYKLHFNENNQSVEPHHASSKALELASKPLDPTQAWIVGYELSVLGEYATKGALGTLGLEINNGELELTIDMNPASGPNPAPPLESCQEICQSLHHWFNINTTPEEIQRLAVVPGHEGLARELWIFGGSDTAGREIAIQVINQLLFGTHTPSNDKQVLNQLSRERGWNFTWN